MHGPWQRCNYGALHGFASLLLLPGYNFALDGSRRTPSHARASHRGRRQLGTAQHGPGRGSPSQPTVPASRGNPSPPPAAATSATLTSLHPPELASLPPCPPPSPPARAPRRTALPAPPRSCRRGCRRPPAAALTPSSGRDLILCRRRRRRVRRQHQGCSRRRDRRLLWGSDPTVDPRVQCRRTCRPKAIGGCPPMVATAATAHPSTTRRGTGCRARLVGLSA